MSRFLIVALSVLLCWIVCVQQASARIPNHHLYYRNDVRAPLTSLEIVFLGAGSNQDGHERAGLALTAARLIEDYSKRHGYAAQLETLGAQLNVGTSFQYQALSLSGLSENFQASVGIVNDLIRRTAFTEFAVEKAKRELQKSYLHSVRADAYGFMRNYALAQTMGVPRWFSSQAVRQLTLEAITQYQDMLLKADVVFFKAISDLDSIAIRKSLLTIAKGRKKGGFVWSPPTQEADNRPGRTAFVIENYSHLKNVYFYLLIPCGKLGQDNYVPNLVSSTLGSVRVGGMLDIYLRDELALVYGTSCNYSSSHNIRYLEIFADPRLENSEELIIKMYEFIPGLADNPRFWETVSELRDNPDFADAEFHEEMTPKRDLDYEVDDALFNFPSRGSGYKSVTDTEVRSFLQKYFVEENMMMILFGPKEHIIEILEKHWPDMTIHVQTVESAIE